MIFTSYKSSRFDLHGKVINPENDHHGHFLNASTVPDWTTGGELVSVVIYKTSILFCLCLALFFCHLIHKNQQLLARLAWVRFESSYHSFY